MAIMLAPVALLTVVIFVLGTSIVIPALAASHTQTAEDSSSIGLDLSPEPVLTERQKNISQTPINQTHVLFTDSGNGTITLPNSTETINFTGTDRVVVSLVDGTAAGKEVFTTIEGNEVINGTVFGIARFNPQDGTGKAVVILLLQTNSTERLASVNGMILAGHIEFFADGTAESTMWEWKSGVSLPTTTSAESPVTNTTTASTTKDGN